VGVSQDSVFQDIPEKGKSSSALKKEKLLMCRERGGACPDFCPVERVADDGGALELSERFVNLQGGGMFTKEVRAPRIWNQDALRETP